MSHVTGTVYGIDGVVIATAKKFARYTFGEYFIDLKLNQNTKCFDLRLKRWHTFQEETIEVDKNEIECFKAFWIGWNVIILEERIY